LFDMTEFHRWTGRIKATKTTKTIAHTNLTKYDPYE